MAPASLRVVRACRKAFRRRQPRQQSHPPHIPREVAGSSRKRPAIPAARWRKPCSDETSSSIVSVSSRAADDEVRQASGLRDHEHDGHDGKRDAADGEQPDGAELQRYVAAGSQRLLQLALALCADDQQPDRE